MHRTSPLALALTAGGLLWATILFVAPLSLGGPDAAARLAAYVYRGAGTVCHQRAERSFRVAGIQQPVCARCAGLYVSGAMAALAAAASVRRRAGRSAGLPDHGTARMRLLFGVAALPTAATVALEFFGLASPSNVARAVCALPLGAVAGWVFVRMLEEPRGQG